MSKNLVVGKQIIVVYTLVQIDIAYSCSQRLEIWVLSWTSSHGVKAQVESCGAFKKPVALIPIYWVHKTLYKFHGVWFLKIRFIEEKFE